MLGRKSGGTIWPELLTDELAGPTSLSRLASHLHRVQQWSEGWAEAIWALFFFPILLPAIHTSEEGVRRGALGQGS